MRRIDDIFHRGILDRVLKFYELFIDFSVEGFETEEFH